jgi:hypothetical protein
MTTLFRAPTIGEPRATGPKNGGVSSYESDVVRPVTTIRGADFAPGKQLEFRMRSTSTRWINWRESKLLVRYKVAFGPDPIITDNTALSQTNGTARAATNLGPACTRRTMPQNVRMTACPNSCLFRDGVRVVQNGVTVYNQPHYYEEAMANLYTKFDDSADSSGSNALTTRRKDMKAVGDASVLDGTLAGEAYAGISTLSELQNPKQTILRMSHDNNINGGRPFEIAEPLWPSCFTHGYFQGPSDFQIFMTISQTWLEDLFHSQSMDVYTNDAGDDVHRFKREYYAAGAASGDEPAGSYDGIKAYTKVVQGIPAAGNNFVPGTVYVEIEDVELLVNYASPAGGQGIVPASQSLKFSELQVATRPLRSSVIAEEVVVPVGTRAVYVTSRQNVHHILADAEELSRAQGGADEVGMITQEAGGLPAGNKLTMPLPITSLQCSIGGVHAPSQMYSDLDTTSGKMARPYADALSVVGKPNGLRGCTWNYEHYCGRTSANGLTYSNDDTDGTGCDGTIGSVAMTERVFPDSGAWFMLRLLTPPNSLSNVLSIRGTLAGEPPAGARQELVVIAVHDQLLNTQYAPPAELPISTSKSPIV